MKLNPPASSSDLEVARQIARRLHQQRRRDDQPGGSGSEEPTRARLTPPPLPQRPAPEPPPAPRRLEPPAPEPPALAPSPAAPHSIRQTPRPEPERPTLTPAEASFQAPEAPPFERPAWSPPPPAPFQPEPEPEPEAEAPPEPAFEPEPLESLAPPPAPSFEVEVEEPEPPPPAPEPELPGVDVDESPLSPEEMVGDAEGSPLDALTDPGDSPFGDELLDAPPVAEEPSPPSWDTLVETCRELAQAGGAMLVDPAGRVFATTGDWPAPGPDAIAGKLVAMMAKTLKDAPTRSISAPLMGMHLTAWRVSRGEGLITAAFIGAAPVRADSRPAIDAEILGGPAV